MPQDEHDKENDNLDGNNLNDEEQSIEFQSPVADDIQEMDASIQEIITEEQQSVMPG